MSDYFMVYSVRDGEKKQATFSKGELVNDLPVEKTNEIKEETHKQIRNEYSYRSFKRSFTLDEKIDATNIEASYINGVLTLNLPKKEVVKVSATEIVVK